MFECCLCFGAWLLVTLQGATKGCHARCQRALCTFGLGCCSHCGVVLCRCRVLLQGAAVRVLFALWSLVSSAGATARCRCPNAVCVFELCCWCRSGRDKVLLPELCAFGLGCWCRCAVLLRRCRVLLQLSKYCARFVPMIPLPAKTFCYLGPLQALFFDTFLLIFQSECICIVPNAPTGSSRSFLRQAATRLLEAPSAGDFLGDDLAICAENGGGQCCEGV